MEVLCSLDVASPISPGSCLPRKRMQTLTLKQLVFGRPSWHCGTVMLMETGRKMDTSTVTTGRVLEQTVENDSTLKTATKKKTGLMCEKRKQQTGSPQQHHAVRHERPDSDI